MDELMMLISGMLYVNCSIDTYELEKFIKEKLDTNDEDTDWLIDLIIEKIDRHADECEEDIASDIAVLLNELIKAKEMKEHPEDAPWQLHLFKWEN